MTSSADESLCQRPENGNGPENSAGGDIAIKYNAEIVATIPSGFNEFEHCVPLTDVDVANDEFQLQSTSTDGTCITSLSVNGDQLLVGKNNDQQSFWIDANDRYCFDNFMASSQITIKNGEIDSSDCKPINQAEVIYGNYHGK